MNPHKPFLFSNYFINVDRHPSGMSMRFATSSGQQIELRECGEDAWKIFKPHFHLPEVHRTACRRYIGMLGDQPVSFIAVVPYANDKHAKDGRKILHLSRVTVLPNFRSQGIGGGMINAVANHLYGEDVRIRLITANPHLNGWMGRNGWRAESVAQTPHGRQVTWEYVRVENE